MITRADNAIADPGRPVTVPDMADRRVVKVRVVDGDQEKLVDGVAHAWTAAAVYVTWRDDHGLQHRDWFPAGDVQAR